MPVAIGLWQENEERNGGGGGDKERERERERERGGGEERGEVGTEEKMQLKVVQRNTIYMLSHSHNKKRERELA